MAKRSTRRRPPKTQTRRPRKKSEPASDAYWDITHRPLQCLVFLLPMVLAYQIGMALIYDGTPNDGASALAAEQLLRWFFSLFGATGAYLPGAALIVVLLVWHIATQDSWKVATQPILGMAGESILLAVPLLFLNRWLPALMALVGGDGSRVLDNLLLSVGAGIYEELVFRLIVISLISFLLSDILKVGQVAAVAIAVIVSSLLFGLHHYPPIGDDAWSTSEFAFRTAAGAYLAAVFVLRGFGLAVGCHIVYDVIAFLQLV